MLRKSYIFTSENIKHIFTPLSSEKYDLELLFYLFTLMVKICMICISSIESDVINKKKIQMFVVNMTFISSLDVKKCIFHSCLRHL